ncbi:MAG: phosphatidylglycerol lysyltransferase domain-containing protein [Methanocalculaceae archaeon]|nr:phosphatidylglycerol lysyltransferase domain-containing protein [Methanocalculaceae archaeon]
MTLSETDYRPVTLKDKPIFDKIFKKYQQVNSECSFVTMICYEHYVQHSFTIQNGRLLLAYMVDDETTYNAPIGEPDPELFEEVFALAQSCGGKIAMNFFDEADVRYMKNAHPETPVYVARGLSDYYYRTEELAELHGRKYLSIRNEINRFNAEYSYTTERLTHAITPEVRLMIEEWRISKHYEANPTLKEEVNAMLFALDHWEELGCEGLVIRILPENTIGAVAVWEELNSVTALIHIEKAVVRYRGIYKIINQETAKELRGRYDWINREGDVDVLGLREAKLRYHPAYCAMAWYIKREEMVF